MKRTAIIAGVLAFSVGLVAGTITRGITDGFDRNAPIVIQTYHEE